MTFDLLFTTPLIYFFIIRNTKIPKTTIVPVFILGIVIASIILPSQNQYYLSLVKTWFLPVVEISVLTYLIITIRKAIKAFKLKSEGNPDFFTAAKEAGNSFLPARVSVLFATELSMFYYGFINWKKRSLNENEFSYYKETSTRMLLVVFIFLVLIETFAVHLLVQQWSTTIAWVLTIVSAYACFQLIGIHKSIPQRPIVITNESLLLRNGIMAETSIKLDQILNIEIYKKSIEKEDGINFLSPFKDAEGHNVLISLKSPETISGFYGIKKEYTRLALFVDEPEKFVTQMEQ